MASRTRTVWKKDHPWMKIKAEGKALKKHLRNLSNAALDQWLEQSGMGELLDKPRGTRIRLAVEVFEQSLLKQAQNEKKEDDENN